MAIKRRRPKSQRKLWRQKGRRPKPFWTDREAPFDIHDWFRGLTLGWKLRRIRVRTRE